MRDEKDEHPPVFKTRTIKRTKVNGVKVYCKALCRNNEAQDVIYYFVQANDGSYKRVTDEAQALQIYELLIKFEKTQLTITL